MFSRRRFLQLAGIAVAAASVPHLTSAAPVFEPVYGRALAATPVYSAPSVSAPLVARLWSDSVTPILAVSVGAANSAWYRLPQGYARRENLQPMIAPARRSDSSSAPPFWAEVSAAVAVVRAWCAADAPLVARIGHGGVLRVIDFLPGSPSDPGDWYGVAESENGDLLGWSAAAAWSPALIDQIAPDLILALDTGARRLDVIDQDRKVLSAPISTGRDLVPGSYPITERRVTLAQAGDYRGVPWALTFGDDLHLSGAYWHNQFGAATPGTAVQVTPPLANWLYPRAATVIVS